MVKRLSIVLALSAALYVWPALYDATVPVLRAAAAFVQACEGEGGGAGNGCTITTTAGNLIVAYGSSDGGTSSQTFTSSNGGETFTTVINDQTAPSVYCGYRLSATGGSTTFTYTGSSGFERMTVEEFSGIASFDEGATVNSGSSTNATTNNVVLDAAGVVSSFFARRASGAITPNGSWTESHEQEGYANISGASAYRLAAAGTYSHTWTSDTGSWKSCALGFAETGGGGGGDSAPPSGLLLHGVGN